MTPEEIVAQHAERVRQADEEAYRAQLAWTTGRFPEYWQERARRVRDRLQSEYESVRRANPAADR